MTEFVRGVVGSLWALLPPWLRRERETDPAISRTFSNGQRHNNNGICSFSRKRKADNYDNFYTPTMSGPNPKYQKVIQSLSKQKRNGEDTVPNGKAKTGGTRKIDMMSGSAVSTPPFSLMTGRGVNWKTNPGHAFNPYAPSKSISHHQQISRENHKRVETFFSRLDSSFEEDQVNTSSDLMVKIPTKGSSKLKSVERIIPITRSKIHETNELLPLGSSSKASKRQSVPNHRLQLYSTTNGEVEEIPVRKTIPRASSPPEYIDLAEEQNVAALEDSRPKVFTSTPNCGRSSIGGSNRFFPTSIASPQSSSTNSPSQTPSISKKSETVDDEDDLMIICEKIISPKYNPYHTNSLAIETSGSKFIKKSWLEESLSSYHTNQKLREDRIDYETKKLAVLKNKSTLPNDIEARIRNNLKLTDIIVLEEPEEPKLPPFTIEMREAVEKVLRSRDSEVVAVTAANIQITVGDLKTLAPGQWLNDNIINSYMDMIPIRNQLDSSLPKVYVFSTFFYPKYLKEGYSSILKRWTRKVDLFSHDLIIFPIHLGVHWCLAVADLRRKTLRFYDSLFGKNRRCLEALLSYLECEHKERKRSELNSSEWELFLETDIPGQENGSDCGVFTCQFAEFLSRDARLSFTQKDMPYFRQRLIYETCKQKIIYRDWVGYVSKRRLASSLADCIIGGGSSDSGLSQAQEEIRHFIRELEL